MCKIIVLQVLCLIAINCTDYSWNEAIRIAEVELGQKMNVGIIAIRVSSDTLLNKVITGEITLTTIGHDLYLRKCRDRIGDGVKCKNGDLILGQGWWNLPDNGVQRFYKSNRVDGKDDVSLYLYSCKISETTSKIMFMVVRESK